MRPIPLALHAAAFLFASHLCGDLEAYLDPGSGSIVLQMTLGGIVAALAAVRLYRDRASTRVLGKHPDDGVAREGR
jgi:hypothetical protein